MSDKSKFKLLNRPGLDVKKWDKMVEKFGPVYAYSWYLDVVCPGWLAVVEGDYKSGFPFPVRKKLGLRYVFAPYFCGPLGLISAQPSDQKLFENMLGMLSDGISYLDLYLRPGQAFKVPKAKVTEKKYQYLSLNRPYESIEKSFSEKTIRNIKKGERSGLTVSPQITERMIVRDFKKVAEKKVKSLEAADFRMLLKLLLTISENKKGFMRAAVAGDGSIHASAYFLESGKSLVYLKGSTTESGRKSGAMEFLFASVMKEFSGRDMFFDFGGSSVEGVARFNYGFTKIEERYYLLQINRMGILSFLKN